MSKKNYFKERIMLLILLFAFMTPFGALAQTIQLTGLVTDAANEPIIGASVVEKGTTNGVITDFDGNCYLRKYLFRQHGYMKVNIEHFQNRHGC